MDVRGLSFHTYHRGSPWSRSANDILLNDHTHFSPRSYWRRSYSPLLHGTSLCQPTEGFDTVQQVHGPLHAIPGNYLTDPEAAEGCQYCPCTTTDQYMFSRFDIAYNNHWDNLGIVL
ncbi:hypothetical protein C8R48DRAFT_723978 [Suillus tomentosus]|nr:hypothetical protein C8R48DRAFT_723978 [Suillus tomentosus]